jgi:hypothetical protein
MESLSSTEENVLNYYETKNIWYTVAFMFLIAILYSLGTQAYLFVLPLIMSIVIWCYPSATISLFPDHFYYEKGQKIISVPWNEVKAIHRDPVRSRYVSRNKSNIGGFFVETSQGFTNYIGAVAHSKNSLIGLKSTELIKEIEKRSGTTLRIGEVSTMKMPNKLVGIAILIVLCFLIAFLGIWYSDSELKQLEKNLDLPRVGA